MEAKLLTTEIFKLIDEKSFEASVSMAERYGEPELLRGWNIRHTTRTAIAPTASSSFILGQVSASIEPLTSNYYYKPAFPFLFFFQLHLVQNIYLILESFVENI